MARPLSLWRCMRSGKVFRPRMSMYAVKGLASAPNMPWCARGWRRPGPERPITAPAIRSLRPPSLRRCMHHQVDYLKVQRPQVVGSGQGGVDEGLDAPRLGEYG